MMSKKNIKLLSSGLLAICATLAPANAKAELMINEIMQSNISGLIDDLNNFPDSWVELWNHGNSSVQLSQYHIGIKSKIASAWALPDIEVAPGEFVLIYCDKEASGLHTSFRLESNKKGDVCLFKDGELIEKISHPAFPAPNIAYGLDPISGKWGYEFNATPGKPNQGGICENESILPPPIFSKEGCISYTPFDITMSLPKYAPAQSKIHFTLDGSLPTKDSPIYSPGEPIRIDKTTTLRAVVISDGLLSSFPTTNSYIFPDHEITLPVISLVTDNDYFYNADFGIYVFGNAPEGNFRQDWRRPVNIEFFENSDNTSAEINMLGECRVAGNWSRKLPLKTLALYANKRFGKKSFDYEFFPDQRPGITDFKSIMLRNAGNDFKECYMRDLVIQQTVGMNADIDYQAGRPCVIFINGVYKGIINIRERSNDSNIYTNYNGLEDIHMVENWNELKVGDWNEFLTFRTYFNEEGHTSDEYQNVVDAQEYLLTHLMSLYYNNCDFPGNNMVLWRPQEEGGKWRILVKDTDFGMGLRSDPWAFNSPSDYPTIEWLHTPNFPGGNTWGNAAKVTLPYRMLTSFDDIRKEYIKRALVYMGDFLNHRATISNIDNYYNQISSEWEHHAALYSSTMMNNLQDNLQYMKDWITNRDKFFPQHFADFYNLGSLCHVKILSDPVAQYNLYVNDILVKSGQFDGFYPLSHKLRIHGDSTNSQNPIVGWDCNYSIVDSDDKSLSEHFHIDSPSPEISLPADAKSVVFTPVFMNSGVEEIDADYDNNIDFSMPFDVYTLSGYMIGNSIQNLDKGVYIIRQGNKSLKYSI